MARETISVNNNHETLKNEFRRVFPNMDFGGIKKIVMRGDMLKIKTKNNAVVRFTGVDKTQISGWIDGTKAKDTEIQDVWKNLVASFGRNSKVPGAYMNEVNANLLNVAHQVGNVMNETLNHANNLSHDVVSNVLKYSDGTHYYQSRAGQYTIHKKTDVTGNPVMTVVHPN